MFQEARVRGKMFVKCRETAADTARGIILDEADHSRPFLLVLGLQSLYSSGPLLQGLETGHDYVLYCHGGDKFFWAQNRIGTFPGEFPGSITLPRIGLLSGIGMSTIGGLGLFQGGSGVGKSLAADTGRTMAALREDVREIKEHLIREVWPRVNETLDDLYVQVVLKETQTFVMTGTFVMKVLALLIVCALYVIRNDGISLQWHRNAYWHSQARAGGSSVDIYSVCS